MVKEQKEESLFRRVFFSIYSYTFLYAMMGVLNMAYFTSFNASLSTLEKRYHFSSSTSGLIMITDNVAEVLTSILIGYYGKTVHKPRWMSIGCLVSGLSIMITALPYFIYGPIKHDDMTLMSNLTLVSKSNSNDQMCMAEPLREDCNAVSGMKWMTMVAVFCFALSNCLRGFGSSIYFTYGTPYLDDNVSKAKMPTFFAFIFAAKITGAPISFYLSSLALKYHEDPFFSLPPSFNHIDPRWIGAWWIIFLATGILMILFGIPLAFFPREFKKNRSKTLDEEAEAVKLVALKSNDSGRHVTTTTNLHLDQANNHSVTQSVEQEEARVKSSSNGNNYALVKVDEGEVKKEKQETSLKNLPREVLDIFVNPIVFCQLMGGLFRVIGLLGYFVFQTKYLEAQFRQSASKASLVSGTTGFAGKIVGVLFGGVLITLLRPGPRALTTFIFIVELSSVFTLLYGASVMGPQYLYPSTTIKANDQLELNNQCNKDCYCDNVRYQPVCENTDMKAYFSPCHAGCKNSYKTGDGGSIYTGCSCIEGRSKTLEKCTTDNERLFRYATIVAIGGMISGSSRSGNMVTFFRSIKPDQKALAVGVTSFWYSLFVYIPYPLIYGKIFDYCCLVWSKECNKRGNCWLYDTNKLRVIFHGVSIALIAIGSVFDLFMIFLSPLLVNLYDEDESNKTTIKQRLMFWRSKSRNIQKIEEQHTTNQENSSHPKNVQLTNL